MTTSINANTISQGIAIPGFVRNSLRTRILVSMSIMLLPLFGLVAAALLGVKSIDASFRTVVDEIIEEIEPVTHLQLAMHQAAMPANDYLIHGEKAERDKFARLSEKVDRALKRLVEPGPFHLEEARVLIGSARQAWWQAQLISERLLALPRPVGDPAAASEMKRMDAHIERAVDLLEQVHELGHKEVEREFARANATKRGVLWAILGIFGLGFAAAVSVGGALAWSILARIKVLSKGARAFGAGNFSRRVQLRGDDELGRLADTFNAMAAELDKTHRALREASIRDPLTGLSNRREFGRRLEEELARCERYRHSLSLLLLDIDHFKVINDSHGHPVGDKILREVADIVKHAVRGSDEVARYGGEEFAVVLPETDKLHAEALAQRICAAVAANMFSADEAHPFKITVSIGLAGFPDDANSGERLIAAADSALYDAKRSGRNCVCSFGPEQIVERRQ